MPTENCLVVEGVEWSPTESTSPIHVAYDEENNAVTSTSVKRAIWARLDSGSTRR